MLGRAAGPASEGAGEGAGFGIADQQGDFRHGVVRVRDVRQGEFPAHVFDQRRVFDAMVLEAPLQGTSAQVQLLADLVQRGGAAAHFGRDHPGDLGEQFIGHGALLALSFEVGLECLVQPLVATHHRHLQGLQGQVDAVRGLVEVERALENPLVHRGVHGPVVFEVHAQRPDGAAGDQVQHAQDAGDREFRVLPPLEDGRSGDLILHGDFARVAGEVEDRLLGEDDDELLQGLQGLFDAGRAVQGVAEGAEIVGFGLEPEFEPDVGVRLPRRLPEGDVLLAGYFYVPALQYPGINAKRGEVGFEAIPEATEEVLGHHRTGGFHRCHSLIVLVVRLSVSKVPPPTASVDRSVISRAWRCRARRLGNHPTCCLR